jgi:hypothetical protein
MLEDTKAARRFESFINDVQKCADETCALDVLQGHHARLSEIRADLNKDDEIAVQQSLDRLIGLIHSEYVICGRDASGNDVVMPKSACDAMAQSRLRIGDYIGKASGTVLVIGSIVYNPGIVTSKFMKLKNVQKLDKLDDLAGAATRVDTYEDKLRAVQNADEIAVAPTRFRNIIPAETIVDKDVVSVYKFTDPATGKTYYLKNTDDAAEISNTRIAADAVAKDKNSIVKVVNIENSNQEELAQLALEQGLYGREGNVWYLTEEMNGVMGFGSSHMDDAPDILAANLRGKPVTIAEQEQILKDIQRITDSGVKHGDLLSNMMLQRNVDGKLEVSIIDFDPEMGRSVGGSDVEDVEFMISNMRKYGLAEYETSSLSNPRIAYHGTDAEIPFTEKLLASEDGASGGGLYGTFNMERADNYGVDRLIRNQNPDKMFMRTPDNRIISESPLNMTNKNYYIYQFETSPDAIQNTDFIGHMHISRKNVDVITVANRIWVS